LIFTNPDISGFHWQRGIPGGEHGYFMAGGLRGLERSENKTVLTIIPDSILSAPEGDAHVTAHITFNEIAIGLTDQEVVETLFRFADRVREIIADFN
jgi:hypothetical protein